MHKIHILIGCMILFGVISCSKNNDVAQAETMAAPRPHPEFSIEDSSKIQQFKSGLQMYVIQEGPGDFPRPGSVVLMDYVGKLANGVEFDNSYKRPEPFVFSLGSTEVIMGIAEGVTNLRYGSKAILIIPPSLGYKDEDRPNIPPNSTLYFHLELLGSF